MIRTKECLIIDDDPDDQEIFLMCVHKLNSAVNCVTADNGAEALSMLRYDQHYTPDYIFLDVNMPKMNGLECLRELKKIDRLNNTRILMYSTTSDRHVVNESKKLGAYDFIVKPTRVSELNKTLGDIFKTAQEN